MYIIYVHYTCISQMFNIYVHIIHYITNVYDYMYLRRIEKIVWNNMRGGKCSHLFLIKYLSINQQWGSQDPQISLANKMYNVHDQYTFTYVYTIYTQYVCFLFVTQDLKICAQNMYIMYPEYMYCVLYTFLMTNIIIYIYM